MEPSCTYVASAAWINQAVFLTSLTVAFLGCVVLAKLRARRLEGEGDGGESLKPEASLATA